MKKRLTVLAVVVMMLGALLLTGCGGGGGNSSLVGNWMSIYPSGLELYLFNDGTGIARNWGRSNHIRWSASGSTLALTFNYIEFEDDIEVFEFAFSPPNLILTEEDGNRRIFIPFGSPF